MAETPLTPEPPLTDAPPAAPLVEPAAAVEDPAAGVAEPGAAAAEPAAAVPEPPPVQAEPEIVPATPEEVLASAPGEEDLPEATPPATPPAPVVVEPPPVAPVPPAAPAVPSIATTLEVPPLESPPGASPEGGGEWELLLGKVRSWFDSGELQSQWDRLRGPLKGVAYLLALVIALRVYASVVGTLDAIPLISGLLELVGLIAFTRFCLTKMVKTSEREKVIAIWRQRWNEFRGKG